MIRIIVQTTDTGDAAHIGGPVQVGYKTFDFNLPDLQQFLEQWHANDKPHKWGQAMVVGAEIIEQ